MFITPFWDFHRQAMHVSWQTLWAKPWATLMTVIVIAVTLLLPAFFWVFTDNLSHVTRQWEQGGRISLYLVPSVSLVDEKALVSRIGHTPGVGRVRLKSSAEGLALLQQQEGMQNIMKYLPANPLPALIEVTPDQGVTTPQALKALFQQLNKDPLIEEAQLDMQWIQRFYAIYHFAVRLANGLMLLLALAVVFIIGNTLRLTIHQRLEEIQVLKLIGAADAYILRPFLYLGVWYGVLGALLALLLLSGLLFYLTGAANQLAVIYQMHYPWRSLSMSQALLLIMAAMIFGWLGARLTVKRQLSFINPCS